MRLFARAEMVREQRALIDLLPIGEVAWIDGGCDAEVGGGGLKGPYSRPGDVKLGVPLASTDKAAVLALMAGATGTAGIAASWAGKEGSRYYVQLERIFIFIKLLFLKPNYATQLTEEKYNYFL